MARNQLPFIKRTCCLAIDNFRYLNGMPVLLIMGVHVVKELAAAKMTMVFTAQSIPNSGVQLVNSQCQSLCH
jgi:hypothetical protein